MCLRIFSECSKTVLYSQPKLIAAANCCAILVLSIITDLVPSLSYTRRNSNEFLDNYIIEPSFNLVTLALLIFVCITLTEPDIRHYQHLVKPISRILLSWILHVTVRVTILLVPNLLGRCQGYPEFDNQQLECILAGHHWNGFNISGHIFSLLYSILIVLEETFVFRRFEVRLRLFGKMADMEIANTVTPTYTDHLLTDLYATYLRRYRKVEPCVRIAYTILALWVITAQVNVLIITFNWQKAPPKILGAVLAVALWLVTYGTIFKVDPDYKVDKCECLPPNDMLDFIEKPNGHKHFQRISLFEVNYGTLDASPTPTEIWEDQKDRSMHPILQGITENTTEAQLDEEYTDVDDENVEAVDTVDGGVKNEKSLQNHEFSGTQFFEFTWNMLGSINSNPMQMYPKSDIICT